MKFQRVEFGKKDDVCVKRTAWATGKIHIILAKGKSSGLAGKKKWLSLDIRLFMPSIDYKLRENRGQFLFIVTFS